MKKLTNDEFIQKSKIIHNNKYDYSKTKYTKNRNKVVIICKLHGEFKFSPKNHLTGQGCYKCGIINREISRKISTEEFIKRASIIHNNKYDYSNTIYINMKSKLKINCLIHGEFEINSQNHISGQGCKECSYDFCIFKRKSWIEKSKGRCGIFYIIRCWNNNEEFYKFGITYRSVKIRYNKNNMPYNYEIIKEITTNDLGYVWDLEKRFKRKKLKNKYLPEIKFPGSKLECFKN